MSIGCLSTAQIGWNVKQYSTETLLFLSGVELKKKLAPAWEEWINTFILRKYCVLEQI